MGNICSSDDRPSRVSPAESSLVDSSSCHDRPLNLEVTTAEREQKDMISGNIGSVNKKITWEVLHSYTLSLVTKTQHEGKGNSSTEEASGQGARVIVNTDGNFHGNAAGMFGEVYDVQDAGYYHAFCFIEINNKYSDT
ncbi:hypothetical protein JHK87_023160 [Glycine soja]|nr:hypothetical protein JHK87_023160 [Glycine soja]